MVEQRNGQQRERRDVMEKRWQQSKGKIGSSMRDWGRGTEKSSDTH